MFVTRYYFIIMSKKQSPIWDYFRENGDLIVCNKCPKTYKLATAKSSAQPLWYHMKSKHNILPETNDPPVQMICLPLRHPRDKRQSLAMQQRGTIVAILYFNIATKVRPCYAERKTQQQNVCRISCNRQTICIQPNCQSSFIRKSEFHDGKRIEISYQPRHVVRNKVFEFYEQAKTYLQTASEWHKIR